VYCWYNDAGAERSKVIGHARMSNDEGWLHVGKLRLNHHVGKIDLAAATFGQVMNHWLLRGKTKTGDDKDHTTMTTDKHNAKKHLSYWSNRLAKDIQPLEIQDWLDSQSYGLRSKLRSTMSAIYRHGQKYRLIPAGEEFDPMPDVSAPTVSNYEAIALGSIEAGKVIKHIASPLLRMLVILVACTGMRISEAIALSWNDVLWETGKIRINKKFAMDQFGKPKSKASKAPVVMTLTLAGWLRVWRNETMYAKDSDLIFPSCRLRGKRPITKSMAAKSVRLAAVLGGVIEQRPEDGKYHYEGQIVTRLAFTISVTVWPLGSRNRERIRCKSHGCCAKVPLAWQCITSMGRNRPVRHRLSLSMSLGWFYLMAGAHCGCSDVKCRSGKRLQV